MLTDMVTFLGLNKDIQSFEIQNGENIPFELRNGEQIRVKLLEHRNWGNDTLIQKT